jgi:hypothetical protein
MLKNVIGNSKIGKAVPLPPCWLQEGEEMQGLLILHLGTRWGWEVSVTPRPSFTLGKGSPLPIGQEAGWAPEPVWTQRLEEKSFASAGDRTPVVQSVVQRFSSFYNVSPLNIYHEIHAPLHPNKFK